MDDLSTRIVKSEIALARRIGLAVHTMRPVNVGAALIPGKFIFDFLGRMREIRWSIDRYMPVRQDALDLAGTRIEDKTAPAPDEGGPRGELVTLLTDYYGKLFEAGGETANAAIRAAFPTRQEFVIVTNTIARAENRLDDAVIEARPDDAKLHARLAEYREHAATQRERFTEEVYVHGA